MDDELRTLVTSAGDCDVPLLMSIRAKFLGIVDAIERRLRISPTTAELRQMFYRAKRESR
jgi:hypothetical protein